MKKRTIAARKAVVERVHGGQATFFRADRVVERQRGEVIWGGEVALFSLEGHPKARRCYAWFEESESGRAFAVLHVPPVTSPTLALREKHAQENR